MTDATEPTESTANLFGLPAHGRQVSPSRTAGLTGLSPRPTVDVPAARQGTPALDAVPDPYSPRGNADLDETERVDLVACEQAVSGLHTALATAGKALAAINTARLYRESHATFDAYVEERWGMRRSQAYRLIESWPVAAALSPIGDTPESHVRELIPAAKSDGIEVAAGIYTSLQDEGGRITATRIRNAVRAHLDHEDADRVTTNQAETSAVAADTTAVAALKAAQKAQRTAWSALTPVAIKQAMEDDPVTTKALLGDIEVQASRTAKRARHRPQ